MQRLTALQEMVDRIRLATGNKVPDLAINILLSVGLREGLSIADLINKLDVPADELYHGLRILTVGQKNDFSCAGLLYADHNDMYFLTRKGRELAGDLAGKICNAMASG